MRDTPKPIFSYPYTLPLFLPSASLFLRPRADSFPKHIEKFLFFSPLRSPLSALRSPLQVVSVLRKKNKLEGLGETTYPPRPGENPNLPGAILSQATSPHIQVR